MLAFNVTSGDSFEILEKFHKKIDSQMTTRDLPMILVGLQSDLNDDREV